MSETKENCWCCRIILTTAGEIKPQVCQNCLDGKHLASESDSDMFLAAVSCRDCKLFKALKVKRSGAQKLFENRDFIKCKGCGKTEVDLKLTKVYDQGSSYRNSDEEILPAKEWRDKSPQTVALS